MTEPRTLQVIGESLAWRRVRSNLEAWAVNKMQTFISQRILLASARRQLPLRAITEAWMPQPFQIRNFFPQQHRREGWQHAISLLCFRSMSDRNRNKLQVVAALPESTRERPSKNASKREGATNSFVLNLLELHLHLPALFQAFLVWGYSGVFECGTCKPSRVLPVFFLYASVLANKIWAFKICEIFKSRRDCISLCCDNARDPGI